jgi:hypothetical protein
MDLKLDNVLVYLENPSRSRVGWWKISDFGISSMVERVTTEHSPRRPSSTFLSVPSPAQSLARITGTARFSVHRPPGPYTAPEIVRIGGALFFLFGNVSRGVTLETL